jgi:hypothetical protein
VIHAALTLGKTLLGTERVGPYLKSLRDTRRQIRTQEVTLDKFLPFMFHNSFIFETRNIREAAKMLTSEDLKRVQWDPESVGLGGLLGEHPHQRHREVDSSDVYDEEVR